MNDTIVLIRKTKLMYSLHPIVIGLIIIIFFNLLKGFNLLVSLFLLVFSVLIVFLERYNAVHLTMYENQIKIDFYLINKTILVPYCEIKEIKPVWDSGLSNIRFKITTNGKNYKFRVKFQDDEFINFLENKTGFKI